ncbi:hypothetical protein SAMN05443633_104269 [Chryseobacterium arachidis]|uniref:Uncharacterized protein n=1 Tax=Chryseobacterium arachidis TaxID=1416778 RepID=A0A1M5BRK3_9FLAO|nr:hypothetical protein [Chryseobacterium arachidis]SHF45095.1 hypothetical protein SAMN05443633_104269 [Chryseobacterium arachidis]
MKQKNKVYIQWPLFLLLLWSNVLFSQYFEYQRESFLRNYETDYSKGKVNINVPFFSLPTNNGLKINIGMSYNTDAASGNDPGAELGMGWTDL